MRETQSVHPDELAGAQYLAALSAPSAGQPSHGEVILTAQALDRIAGRPTVQKQLGDFVQVPADASHLAQVPMTICADSSEVDVYVGGSEELDTLASILGGMSEDEHRVTVVVPLARLGEAHLACRSTTIARVQAYWRAGDSVAFGQAEIP